MNNTKWESYWSKQQDPRHSVNQDDFFEEVAKEMLFHLGDMEGKKILEIGCGDGALLKFLPITADQYTGVDFSDSLLQKFGESYPDYSVIKMGGIEYLKSTDQQYDIIFSFGVLQYFDEKQLAELFLLQKTKLSSHGYAFHFGIPVAEHKKLFTTGKGIQSKTMFRDRSYIKQVKSKFYNNIGNWHKLNSLCDLSLKTGFEPHIYGGSNYMYRINLLQSIIEKQV